MSITSCREFQYKPLREGRDEIRLLHIEPGTTDSQIRCYLKNANLHHQTAYQALSYTWGDPIAEQDKQTDNPKEQILLKGTSFEVESNLHNALIYLRRRSILVVWVDAICINQTDDEERGRQVLLMGLIYSRADGVLVWLGHQSDGSDLAFDTITNILLHDARGRSMQETHDPRTNNTYLSAWQAILKLFHRRWFRRAWIIQEVVLAKQLVFACGTKELAGDEMFRMVVLLG